MPRIRPQRKEMTLHSLFEAYYGECDEEEFANIPTNNTGLDELADLGFHMSVVREFEDAVDPRHEHIFGHTMYYTFPTMKALAAHLHSLLLQRAGQ